MLKVRNIREQFCTLLGRPDEKGMLEIAACQFEADEPAIFGTPRHEWHERELEWYRSMSLNVADIPPPIPSMWQQVSGENGEINSNYGWCIWSEENGSQYERAIRALEADLYSRQAIMIYTRPSMHDDFNRAGAYDFICTNHVQLLVRMDQQTRIPTMMYIVNMRSSDAIFGYKGDYAWHDHVFDLAVSRLRESTGRDIVKGRMVWNAGSFHIYPRHQHLVRKWEDESWEIGSPAHTG